jgi:aspartyl-tRNA(Asn)/glutamyl-tRNA(Gln) amidotransferase subunit A
MDAVDLCYLPLADVARLLRTGAVSPVEVAEAVLARVERLQPILNAFIRVDGEAMLAGARRAEQQLDRGDDARGPLHGVPISLKDLFDVAGQPTTAGSRILAEHRAGPDATVWARLRTAGALLIGKTNLHEFAYGATTVNPLYGATRNPWHTERIAGGSSGGSAAAVAAGLGYGSLGSDTGGSIRCPAALAGVTGLKPTYGRVPRTGVFPLSWAQDHVGPLARTAYDCAVLLDAIAGPDPADPTTLGIEPPRAAEALEAVRGDLRGVRAGVVAGHRASVADPEVGAAFDRAVGELAELGAEIREIELPEESAALDAGLLILLAEAAAVHLPWLRERPGDYGPDVRARLEAGALVSAVDYIDAQRARKRLVPLLLERMAGVDVLLGPTVPVGAPPIEATTIRLGQQDVEPRTVLLRLTRLFDVTGQPVVSVPCGFTAEGLPLGLQIAGQPWQEARVLGVAHAYQQATDWHRRRPPIDGSPSASEQPSAYRPA